MPGKPDRHFWVPEYTTSAPQASACRSIPASDVTASIMTNMPADLASRHSVSASLLTPVEVSAWTKATAFASGCSLIAASSFSGSTGSPQRSITMTAVAPQRSTFSFIRPPNTPFWHTITLSEHSTRLTKAASMPAEPGADSGIVNSFSV